MNISYKWLKEYVDFDLTPQETADALTSIGLEVGGIEEVETIKGGLKGLVVGQVLTCEPHPDSDHMHVCTVNIGEAEPSQIVCGAPNVSAGQKVIVATLGTKLYDGDKEFVIKKSKLRGIESYGMICAEDEIGVGSSHDGIIVLPEDTTVGLPAAKYYHLESDSIIEVDITPNRADACSHYGVARDLYAWLKQNNYKTSLHRPSTEAFKVDNHDLEISIEIEDKQRCPRYSAVTVTGCEVKESPKWLQDYLQIIGIRPINNIVDITNYIMMAYGQPLHCFDADMVTGRKVVVKTLPEGTTFVTLDDTEHKLSSEDLAICNAEEPMCIAGVFGGKGSGTYETTTNVLFESAYFSPTSIRKTARRQGLGTDASFRFERGVDPNGTIYALKQAAIMAKELAGGKISMDIADVYPQPVKPFPVVLNIDYANRLIGKALPKETYKSIAESLEMRIISETADELQLEVPTYRVDVQRPCDVVEDMLRIYGYNNVEIPVTVQSALTVKGLDDRSNKLQNVIAEQLTGQGFHEIMNNSPQSLRRHIAIFGRRNVGKSSLLNALTGQQVAIVSPEAGTTTDPVNRAMEILPLGPCLLIDTAGFDDVGHVGELRNKRTHKVLDQTDMAMLVMDQSQDLNLEKKWLEELQRLEIPTVVVLNKGDTFSNIDTAIEQINYTLGIKPIAVSAKSHEGIDSLRKALAQAAGDDEQTSLTAGLAKAGDTVLLVMPQDPQAPKGRLILPQVQTIRDLTKPPAIIITDSQVFSQVYQKKPEGSLLTSFSVLMAATKGNIEILVEGAKAIDRLTPKSRILIAEACTHAPMSEDIGREKIPRMIRKKYGESISFDIHAGKDYPTDLKKYDLIVHCGACMFNRRLMLSRIMRAQEQGVPITNYGLAIAQLQGILDKVSLP